MNSAIVSQLKNVYEKLQEEDNFFPTEWICSKCHFLNNDDESCCQNIFGGHTCSTRRHNVVKSWDGTSFFAKSQPAANNEPRVSGSNEAVCTAGNSGLAEKKKKTPRMLRELESTLGDYWKGSGKRGSRRRQ